MKRLLLMALAALTVPQVSSAQDLDEGLDEEASESSDRPARERRRPEVKEVSKGFYAKTNVGGGWYLGSFRTYVKGGPSVSLGLGLDFVDNESFSMAGEVAFTQGIHNGTSYELQAQIGCPPAPCVEGDLRTYTFSGAVEASIYPSRRVGIGLRLGGGILASPLLIDETAYNEDVLADWGVVDPGYHTRPHPIVLGGPTFEYYSKLSHFSVGVDLDGFYAIAFDLGLNGTAFVKYTF